MRTVRAAGAGDESPLASIDLATWTPATSPAPLPSDVDAYRFFNARTAPSDVLVLEVDGVMTGYVKLRSPTPLASHAHVLEIGGLAVDPGRQGAGLGQQLVDAAVQGSIRRGARTLSLRVLETNTGARRLYEKCNFVVEGVLQAEFRLGGRYVDDLLMARHLVPTVP